MTPCRPCPCSEKTQPHRQWSSYGSIHVAKPKKNLLASSSGIASLPGGGAVHQNAMVTGKPPFTTLQTGKSWKITMRKK